MPTLLEVTGAEQPETFPGRELTPLAGVSLLPLLAGEPMPSRPPIHLLFSKDRGLRDGPWKLVSFRGGPWELYNIEADRTELIDLAAEHPEIVERMAAQWHAMTADVLKSPKQEQQPVATAAGPKQHRDWSIYTGHDGPDTTSRRKAR
jgi:arylsulfatase A-like enzyme